MNWFYYIFRGSTTLALNEHAAGGRDKCLFNYSHFF